MVEIMRTEWLARLAGDDVHGGAVEVGEVHGDALGRTVKSPVRFHGPLVAIKRNDARTSDTLGKDGAKPGDAPEDGMFEVRGEFLGARPRADLEGAGISGDGAVECRHQ